VGPWPNQIAVNPNSGEVYVSYYNQGTGFPGNTVTIINSQSNSVARTFTFQGPSSLGVDTLRNRVYIAAVGANSSFATLGIMDGGQNVTGMVGVPGSFSGETAAAYAPSSLLFEPTTGAVYAVEYPTGTSGGAAQVKVFQQPAQLAQADSIQFASAAPEISEAPASFPGGGGNGPVWTSSNGPQGIYTILEIHGRYLDQSTIGQCPSNNLNCLEPYGAQTYDENGAWGAGWPAFGPRYIREGNGQLTLNGYYAAQVIWVQWDSWNHGFDYTGSCGSQGACGGWAVMNQVMAKYCNLGSFPPNPWGSLQSLGCSVICHSAGCAAFENWLAKAAPTSAYLPVIMEAGSASGGSEIANIEEDIVNAVDLGGLDPWGPDVVHWAFGQYVGNIDVSLETGNARNIYQHNDTDYNTLYNIAGTNPQLSHLVQAAVCTGAVLTASGALGQPGIPSNGLVVSNDYNHDCYLCGVSAPIIGATGNSVCFDDLIFTDSGCAHNNTGGYQGCNSTLPGYSDNTTYDGHGFWGSGPISPVYAINNPYESLAPFSYSGQHFYNPTYHTYGVTHDGTKGIAVQEYGACNLRGTDNCF
jgi:hypothetical protein